MKPSRWGAVIAAAVTLPLGAQDIKMPLNLDRLAEHATETVDVTLDASMLQLASKFLSKDDPDQMHVKQLVSKLKGVYVRSFEFDKDGQYSKSDLDAIRSQLKRPDWTRIVGVKSTKGEYSEIYVKKNGDQVAGLVVLNAEPKELTLVHIDGAIDPEELSQLGGHLGIPRLDRSRRGETDDRAKSKSKDEE
ncbi:MAG: DUF4252 domain-containing protein [Bryobacteraceae bacterium]|jgi:hypothetical protein